MPIPTDNIIVPDVDDNPNIGCGLIDDGDDYANVGRDLNDDGDDYATSFYCQYWKHPKMRRSLIFFSNFFILDTLQCEKE